MSESTNYLIHGYKYDSGLGDLFRSIFNYYIYCKKNDINFNYNFFNNKLKYCIISNDEPPENYIELEDNRTYFNENTKNVFKMYLKYNIMIYSTIGSIENVDYDDYLNYRHSFLNFIKFSDDIITRFTLEPKSYSVIHIRTGDKFIKNGHIKTDVRISNFDVSKLLSCINFLNNIENKIEHKTIILLTDNYELRTIFNNIKNNNKNLYVPDTKICHCADHNITKEEMLDIVYEFYIILNSKRVVSFSNSGFSKVSALIGSSDYYIYDNDNFIKKDFIIFD